jgi:hypothetical protein
MVAKLPAGFDSAGNHVLRKILNQASALDFEKR